MAVDDPDEMRRVPRYRTFKGGRIVYGSGSYVVNCLIRNLSHTGAKLKVDKPFDCPERITLKIIEGPSYQCHVLRQDGTELAVEFLIEDHRTGPRFKANMRGRIVFDNGRTVIDCQVRDLSDDGARLKVDAPFDFPDTVSLELIDGPSYQCRVTRHGKKELGVEFVRGD